MHTSAINKKHKHLHVPLPGAKVWFHDGSYTPLHNEHHKNTAVRLCSGQKQQTEKATVLVIVHLWGAPKGNHKIGSFVCERLTWWRIIFSAEDVYFLGDVNIGKNVASKAPGSSTAALCMGSTCRRQQHHLVFSPSPQRSSWSPLRAVL